MIGHIFSAIQSALLIYEAEENMLNLAREGMSAEQYAEYINAHNALRIKREAEEVENRRHKEICESIRSTSFWRFGR